MSTEPKIDVDLQTLLVRQVSALVEAPAEALHGNSDEQIRTMALLYRVLAANCVEKAQMAEAFGPPPAPEEDDDD
jgi:hypothetical protein